MHNYLQICSESESTDLYTVWNAFQKAIHDGGDWRQVSILTSETMKNHTGLKSEIFEGVHKIAETGNNKVLLINLSWLFQCVHLVINDIIVF